MTHDLPSVSNKRAHTVGFVSNRNIPSLPSPAPLTVTDKAKGDGTTVGDDSDGTSVLLTSRTVCVCYGVWGL